MKIELNDRIAYLDFLRGIAVLGLILVNITDMGIFSFGYVSPEVIPLSDTVITQLRILLFDGRFRSLFCLLFSVSLYLQYQKLESKNLPYTRIIKTRLWWLVAFGLIHGVFIWPGDILLTYGLCGLLLVKKLHWSEQKLIRRGIIYFSVGLLLSGMLVIIPNELSGSITRNSDEFLAAYNVLTAGYSVRLIENLVFVLAILALFPFVLLFYVLGVMLIGLGLYKRGLLQNGFNHRQLKILIGISVISVSVDIVLCAMFPSHAYEINGEISCVSGLSMALLFWHWVVVSRINAKTHLIIDTIRRAGKMALSLYLLQSVVGTLLLQHVFPEWNLTLTLIQYMGLAALLILIQLALASIYFNYFQQGPMEYVWRKLINIRRFNMLT